MLPGCSTRPEIRVKLFCEDPRDAARHRDFPEDLDVFFRRGKGVVKPVKQNKEVSRCNPLSINILD